MDFLFTLKFLKIVAASIFIFILLDFLWLAIVASKLYSQSLGFLAMLDSKGRVKVGMGACLPCICRIHPHPNPPPQAGEGIKFP